LRFKTITQVLKYYYDPATTKIKSMQHDKVRVDGGKTDEAWIEQWATIGYHVNALNHKQRFVLVYAYGYNSSDKDIAGSLNYANATKNNTAETVESLRVEVIRKLDTLFKEIGVISDRNTI